MVQKKQTILLLPVWYLATGILVIIIIFIDSLSRDIMGDFMELLLIGLVWPIYFLMIFTFDYEDSGLQLQYISYFIIPIIISTVLCIFLYLILVQKEKSRLPVDERVKEPITRPFSGIVGKKQPSVISQDKSVNADKLKLFRNAISRSKEIPFDIAIDVLGFDSEKKLIGWLWDIDLPGFELNYSTRSINVKGKGEDLTKAIDSLLNQYEEMESNKTGKI
ncbi:MAG: hypothetical protein ACXAEU_20015 [Candidatus Hodarchaeales archaeon]